MKNTGGRPLSASGPSLIDEAAHTCWVSIGASIAQSKTVPFKSITGHIPSGYVDRIISYKRQKHKQGGLPMHHVPISLIGLCAGSLSTLPGDL